MAEPTVEERYEHLRDNADAFVQSMKTMIAACERDGNAQTATHLRVWCLMPWEATIRDDDSGDLWFICEACGEPIKNDADRVSGDGCDFHRHCVKDIVD